jgi:hypothetical protein
MNINRISIHRENYTSYSRADPTKPFRATVEVEGQLGKIELNLDEAMSKRIIEVIAEELVKSARATAEAMVATVLDAKPVAKALA